MFIFLIIHYICTYIQIFPQVFKLIKTKSSNDYSLCQLTLAYIGVLCWTIYAYTSNQSILLIIGTSVETLLITIINIIIIIYYKFK